MLHEPNLTRRHFIGSSAIGIAAALGMNASVNASASSLIKPARDFGPIKQIDAGVLDVGYAEAGPVDGPAVILFHGWPYDIHTYVDVAPLLAAKGYRVIIPYLRGYGTTRFLSKDAVRNGQQSSLALDAIALMDALHIKTAIVAGCDWGARTANILAALWPERCKAMVSVSGYLIGNREAGKMPLPPKAELQWWYQYYFTTDRGRAGYEKYTQDFAKLIWQIASPKWRFDDATFERSGEAFDNPDHVQIVIHNYRWRYRRSGSIAWGRSDKESASISVTVDLSISVPYLELKYSYFDQPTQYRVKLVNVPSNLGRGRVWYFVCPRTSKRCRILYGIDGYFLHREAFQGVIYASQTWSKQARNMARMVDVVCGDRPKRRYYAGKPTKSYQRWSKKLRSLDLP